MASHGCSSISDMAATRPGFDEMQRPRNGSEMPDWDCVLSGRKWLPCDMYRHAGTDHLDLAAVVRVARCPGAWSRKGYASRNFHDITIVRGAHDDNLGPEVIQVSMDDVCLHRWTVRPQVWSDSLAANHSGISTDVLLFSNIHISLTHHYRVHKRGLLHIAFRKNY